MKPTDIEAKVTRAMKSQTSRNNSLDEAAQYIKDCIAAGGENWPKLSEPMIDDITGIYLFKTKECEVFLLSTGQLAEFALKETRFPTDVKTLTEREAADKHGAKKCIEALGKALDDMATENEKIARENREAVAAAKVKTAEHAKPTGTI